MKFSQDFIEKVAESNNLIDIISQYTQLKPSAGGYMGRCPFPDHPEKTASFSVSESKQVYHCFGCKKSGNLFSFLRDFNGMAFPEAVEYLANRAHIPMPVADEADQRRLDNYAQKKRLLFQANQVAAEVFFESLQKLPSQHPVKMYLQKRGLSSKTIQEFQIGYALDEWDHLSKTFERRKITLPIAEEARLVRLRTNGQTGYYDLFRDRIMFPIHSLSGEVVGFGGRIVNKGEPKYLNSPESLVFHKNKILFGLNHSAKHIRSEDCVLVVEGYMDLVSLYQAGICNVVATMGTALTPEHAKALRRLTKNVIVLFDGDAAGINASERSLPVLLAADLHAKNLTLPDELDPDEFVMREGAESLRTLMSRAENLFVTVLKSWMRGYRGEASQKVQMAEKLRPIFACMQDRGLKQLYFDDCLQKLALDREWLLQALFQEPQQKRTGPPIAASTAATQVPEITKEYDESLMREIHLKGISQAEATLMSLVLKSRENLEVFRDTKVLFCLQHDGAKKVLQRALELYGQAPEKFDKLASLLATFVDEPEWLFCASEVGLESSNKSLSDLMDGNEAFETNAEAQAIEKKLLIDSIRKVQDDYLSREVKQLSIEIKTQSSHEKMEKLMRLQRDRIALKEKQTPLIIEIENK